MLRKLRRKFVILTTVISVVVMLVILCAVNFANYTSMIYNSDELLFLLSENNLNSHGLPPRPDRFSQEIAFTTRYFSVMTDKEGNIDFIDTRNISSVTSGGAIEFTQQVSETGSTSGTIDNYRYSVADNGYGYTYLFLDIEEELRSASSYLFYSVIILVIAVFVIFGLSFFASKYAVSPIVKSYERQKRFITDVSHELKTPLSIIKANNEVLELDYGQSEWTDSVNSQVSRLTSLVESLVSLTRTDEEQKGAIKTNFSLSDALCETAKNFDAPLAKANLKLNLNIEKNFSYYGDESALRKLFEILIENAVKYSPGNTAVDVSLMGNPGRPVLTVKNECPGIAPGRHDNWFDRFYREDTARTGGSGGFGIGLSIAKNICDKHKAKITAKSTDGDSIVILVGF